MKDRSKKEMLAIPGYAWCMSEGAVVSTMEGRHYVETGLSWGPSGGSARRRSGYVRCGGVHRQVAAMVSKEEYPEFTKPRKVE